jgi:hypothetical protein
MHSLPRHLGGQFHASAALPPVKTPRYPLDRRLNGSQSRPGCGGEEKNSEPPLIIEIQNPDRPSRGQSLYRLSYPDSVRMDLREMKWEGMNWMHLARDRDQWRIYVRTVMNLRIP